MMVYRNPQASWKKMYIGMFRRFLVEIILKRMPIVGLTMIDYEFRKAASEDIPKIVHLLKETIADVYGPILPEDALKPWTEGDQLSLDVNNAWQNMIVAEKAGEIVAVAAGFNDFVGLIWVHPAHQRKGLGGRLLDIIEAEIKGSGYWTAKLACFSANEGALRFYQDKGWKILSLEKDEAAGAMKTVMGKTLAN
jgi:GNAT superfamily N-acetyltransferase